MKIGNNLTDKTGRGLKFLCIGLLLSVTLIWGCGIIATDEALTGSMGVFTMLAGRFLLAAVILFVLRLCLFRTKGYTKIAKRELWAGIAVGTVNFCGFVFQSVGLLYTDTAKSGMLTGAYVVFVPVIYCVLRKKFQWRPLFNALLFLVGMFFLFDFRGTTLNFNRGDAVTLLCAWCFAVQIILVDRFADDINVFNFNAVQMLTMGLLGLTGALLVERQNFAFINWSVCLPAVIYLGALSSAYAYIVQTFAQSRVSPSLTAILLSLESLAGVLFSLTAGKVGWTWTLGVGCAIMAAASVAAALGDSRAAKTSDKAVRTRNPETGKTVPTEKSAGESEPNGPEPSAAFGRLEPTAAFKAENRASLAAAEGFFEEISEEFFESFSEEGEGAGACMTAYGPMPARNDKR